MVKPQDSGQPPSGSVGDPQAHKRAEDSGHPGTRKRNSRGTTEHSAEGNDPSLTHGPTRRRMPKPR